MLQQWRIGNFKSVSETAKLEMRPLTLLVGANSSGKSTVLQSILLIAQTILSKVPSRHLILNGELTRLGTFEDVLTQGSSAAVLKVGFTLDVPFNNLFTSNDEINFNYHRFYMYRISDPDSRFKLTTDLEFGSSDVPSLESKSLRARRLLADIVTAKFTVQQSNTSKTQANVHGDKPNIVISRRSLDEVNALASSTIKQESKFGVSVQDSDLHYDAQLSTKSTPSARPLFRGDALAEVNVVGVRMAHFFPSYFINKQSKLAVHIWTATSEILNSSPLEAVSLLKTWIDENDPVKRAIASVFDELINKSDKKSAHGYFQYLRRRGPFLPVDSEDDWQRIVQDQLTNLSTLDRAQKVLTILPLPRDIELATALQSRFFSSIRYLGPLRDDPRPMYSLASGSDPKDVGLKGEYTAAVLDLYQDEEIDYLPPGQLNSNVIKAPLKVVINKWLQYFSIAENVYPQEEGKEGHRLMIEPGHLSRPVDTTNVGVGVSQLLPILVMALVSRQGSLLLFEQPELHLHPAVQSLLADFFMSISRTGRQCVLETHSEYLVNRMRLRIAEEEIGGTLSNDIIIHFVERQKGASTFRTVEINEFGSISEWPTGFFDQGPDESGRILQAAFRKRAKTKVIRDSE